MNTKHRKIRDEQKGFLFIILIIVITVLLGLGFYFALRTNRVVDSLKDGGVFRVLFITEDEDSDVLFANLLVYSPTSHKAAVISIPNYVGRIFSSLGRVDKISTVYEEKGIAAFREEIEELLGVNIPYYTIIKIDDFVKLTDMLGGMRVFIAEPIDYTDDSGERFLLPSGVVNLDGDKVKTYLSYRLPDETESDLQERFQNIMTAFLSGLHDKNFIIFDKHNFDKYMDCLSVNLEEEEKITLFQSISEIDAESIIRQTITGSIRNLDGKQLLFPLNNGEFIKEAIKQTTNMLVSADGALTSRVYVIEIQNGTTTQGLARNTAILFQNASYDVLSAVNADRNDYEETVIINRIGNEEVAKMVGEFIHCTNIIQPDSLMEEDYSGAEASVDFTVILGKDFNGRYVVPKRSK